MKTIIAGSRDIVNINIVHLAVLYSDFNITEIVSGAARGVDNLAIEYAKRRSIKLKKFPVLPSEWDTLGKKAGYIRNIKMSEYADQLIAIWDGVSPGTKHMIDIMKKANKKVFIVFYKQPLINDHQKRRIVIGL